MGVIFTLSLAVVLSAKDETRFQIVQLPRFGPRRTAEAFG